MNRSTSDTSTKQKHSRRWHLVHLLRWTTMGTLLVATAAILLTTFGFLYIEYRREVGKVRQELTNQTKMLMRGHVDLAVEFINFTRKELDWPEDKIQAFAKKRLEQISYADGQGYILVDSYTGLIVVNPNSPDLIGQDLWEMEDVNGVKIAQTLVAAAKRGGDFVSYTWVHPITKLHEEKLTYARGIDDWEWAVCSGLYLTDVNEGVAARQYKLRSDLYKHAAIILGIAALSLSLFALVSLRISRRMGNELSRLEADIIAGSESHVDLKPDTYRIQEFAVIATGANRTFKALTQMSEELHKEQQVVRKSEAKFRGLVESSCDWIWEVNKEGVYTYASPQVEVMLGYKPEEVVGRNVFDLMPPEEAKRIAEIFKEVMEKDEAIGALENINLHKDGRRVVLETSGVPVLDESGQLAGYRGVDRDITERVRIGEIMVQSEKMMSVGGLAAGMAHEINNPLAGMMQTADVLGRRLTDNLPANESAAEEAGTTMDAIRAFMKARDIPNMLERIHESGKRAAEIVTNMLSFAHKSDSSFSTCDLAKLLDQTADLAGSDYDLKKNMTSARSKSFETTRMECPTYHVSQAKSSKCC